MKIQHRQGKLHGNAKALSRNPCKKSNVHPGCDQGKVKDNIVHGIHQSDDMDTSSVEPIVHGIHQSGDMDTSSVEPIETKSLK